MQSYTPSPRAACLPDGGAKAQSPHLGPRQLGRALPLHSLVGPAEVLAATASSSASPSAPLLLYKTTPQ